MSDKKHIDRLFQEKFKDFDVAPKDHVWEQIEARLNQKKKKRRVIPIWWQLGGVAAALLLMFAIGNSILTNKPVTPSVVETNTNNIQKPIDTKETITQSQSNKSSVVSNTQNNHLNKTKVSNNRNDNKNFKNSFDAEQNKDALAKNTKTSKTSNNSFYSKNNSGNTISNSATNNIASNSSEINQNRATKNTELKSNDEIKKILNSNIDSVKDIVVKSENTETINDSEKETDSTNNNEKGQDIEAAIAEANKIIEKEEEKEIRRWSIAPNVAPVYFNSLGDGSSIDAQFTNNNTTSDISMSYGVEGSYAINNRLKITAGVNRVNFNNTTTDVIALSDNGFSAVAAPNGRLQNINLKEDFNTTTLTLISRPNISANTVSESIRTISTGDLEQRFGFIEIPLEIEYRLVDKKLGLNVISGFSTLFLNANEIFADVNGENTLLGEANNINNTSFSANFGIGIDYKLSEKLNINLEPKFKYQLNTFNNTSGNFRPFFIGVYTGLNFKF